MDKILLRDTGLLPEKIKEIEHRIWYFYRKLNSKEGYEFPNSREGDLLRMTNDALEELGETDLSAWLKENGYINMSEMVKIISQKEKAMFRSINRQGYIKLSDVELDVEKVKDVITKEINRMFGYSEDEKDPQILKERKVYIDKFMQAIADSKPFKAGDSDE